MAEEVAVEALTAESGEAGRAEGAEPEPEAAVEAAVAVAVAKAPAAEAVEIPKQQSADVAADSEAGEGART
ncbi:gliding motility protein [Streptomyces sp. NPDC056224]|uniref:gliding motility protein n=1 Tax=Streptomyces sp. NPDC056224 TaxID=3345750 RepID=UPI0035E25157